MRVYSSEYELSIILPASVLVLSLMVISIIHSKGPDEVTHASLLI